MDKMKITSSESKGKLERSGNGLIISLGFNTKAGLQRYKKARYTISNVSKMYLSKIIKEIEKIEKLPYEKKRPKHEPTYSYFHLARQVAKCMMRSDNLNWHNRGGYTKMTDPSLKVNSKDKGRTKIYHCAQKIILELFYGHNRIKMQHCQQNFIAEQFRRRISVYY